MLSYPEFCDRLTASYYFPNSTADILFYQSHLCSDEILYFGVDYLRCANMQYPACQDRFFDPYYNRSASMIYSLTNKVPSETAKYPCCSGFYCPSWMTCLIPCPVGAICPSPNLAKDIPLLTPCPLGYYCPSPVIPEPIVCPEGSYCPTGSVAPTPCTSLVPWLDLCTSQTGFDPLWYQTLLSAGVFLICLVLLGHKLQQYWMNPLTMYQTMHKSKASAKLLAPQPPTQSDSDAENQSPLVVDAIVYQDIRIWRNGRLVFTLFSSSSDQTDNSQQNIGSYPTHTPPLNPSWLVLRPGVTACVGLSGAGKSTLLHVLAKQSKLLHHLQASVFFHQQHHKSSPASSKDSTTTTILKKSYDAFWQSHGQSIAYVAQHASDTTLFCQPLTVWESLWFHFRLRMGKRSWSQLQTLRHISFWLKQLQLLTRPSLLTQLVPTLSGGELKRLSIAMELICEPSVLFIDEPTSGLDAQSAELVLGTLQQFSRGMTSRSDVSSIVCPRIVVLVVHQPSHEIAQLYFDRILGLYQSPIVPVQLTGYPFAIPTLKESRMNTMKKLPKLHQEIEIVEPESDSKDDDMYNEQKENVSESTSCKTDQVTYASHGSQDVESGPTPSPPSNSQTIPSTIPSTMPLGVPMLASRVALLDLPLKTLQTSDFPVSNPVVSGNAEIEQELIQLLSAETCRVQQIATLPKVQLWSRVNMMDNYLLSLSITDSVIDAESLSSPFVCELQTFLHQTEQCFSLPKSTSASSKQSDVDSTATKIWMLLLQSLGSSCFHFYPFYLTAHSATKLSEAPKDSNGVAARMYWIRDILLTQLDQAVVSCWRVFSISLHKFWEVWVWNVCLAMTFGYALGYFHSDLSSLSSSTLSQIASAYYLLPLAVSLVCVQAGIRLRRAGCLGSGAHDANAGAPANSTVTILKMNLVSEEASIVDICDGNVEPIPAETTNQQTSSCKQLNSKIPETVQFERYVMQSNGSNSQSSHAFIGYSSEGMSGVSTVAVYVGETVFELIWLTPVICWMLLWFRCLAQSRSPFLWQFLILLMVGLAATSIGHALVAHTESHLLHNVVGGLVEVLRSLVNQFAWVLRRMRQYWSRLMYYVCSHCHRTVNKCASAASRGGWSRSNSGGSGEVGTWGIYINLFMALLAGYSPQARTLLDTTSSSSSSSSNDDITSSLSFSETNDDTQQVELFMLASPVFFTTDSTANPLPSVTATYHIASSSTTAPSEQYSLCQTFHDASPYQLPLQKSISLNRAQWITLPSYLAPALQALVLTEFQALFPASRPIYYQSNSANSFRQSESGLTATAVAAGLARAGWYEVNILGDCEYLNYHVSIPQVADGDDNTDIGKKYIGKIHKLVCPFHHGQMLSSGIDNSTGSEAITTWSHDPSYAPVLFYVGWLSVYVLSFRLLCVICGSLLGFVTPWRERLHLSVRYLWWLRRGPKPASL